MKAKYKSSRRPGRKYLSRIAPYLIACLVLAVGPGHARADDDWSSVDSRPSGVKGEIQEIGANYLTIADQQFTFGGDEKVEKDGFKFAMSDLRAGWNIELKSKEGAVKSVKVLGIPTVQAFPPYHGLKQTVMVGRLRMGNLSPQYVQASVDLQSAVESIMLAALDATGMFNVIDSRARDEILNEVDFSQSGYANAEIAEPAGRAIPADYLVRGHVVSFGQEQKSGKGVGAFGVKIGSKRTDIRLKMELTFEEVATGVTLKTFTQELNYSNKGTSLGVDVGSLASSLSMLTNDMEKLVNLQKIAGTGLELSENSYYESPIGEVLGLVTNRLVEQLSEATAAVPWSSVIVAYADDKAVIRGGKDVGLKVGDTLVLHKSTNEMVDPDTGMSLGSLAAPAGVITVRDVRDRMSICSYEGSVQPVRGDKCALNQP